MTGRGPDVRRATPAPAITDPVAELSTGDVIEIHPGAWRVIVDVRPATDFRARDMGACRVDSIGWTFGRRHVLTWWPIQHAGRWRRVGTAAGLGWVAPDPMPEVTP